MLGRFLVALGGLVVVALFAALLAPFFVDWTDFRSDFEDRASRILGKKVTVNGAVEARILPFPSVTMHDVTVGRDDNGEPLVQVARFSMDAELAPFLSGEARIFDMRIEEPKVRLRLLENGTLDWLRGSNPAIPARTVVLESVRVSGGTVEFIDEQTGRIRRIESLQADMRASSLAGPWTIEGRGVLDGEAGAFSIATQQMAEGSAALPIRTRLMPDMRPFTLELDGTIALKEDRPSYEGRFDARWLADKEATVVNGVKPPRPPEMKGEFSLTNEAIRIPSYRLELGDADNPYAVNGEATLDTGQEAEFLLTAEGQQIDVNRIGNEGANGKTGRDPSLSARQRLMGLVARAAEIPIPSVPGRATLRLPAIVAGDTVVRDIQLDLRPDGGGWTVDKAVAVLPGRTTVEASGDLRLSGDMSFTGDLLVASTQPSGLSQWLAGSVDPAIRGLASLGFSARVDLTPEIQRFDRLELAMGGATLNGRIERQSFVNSKPNITFDLNGNAVDLEAMQAVYSLVAGETSAESFFAHQIGARLTVDELTYSGITARDVDTTFTVGEEGISLEKLEIGNLGGAVISASGRASGSLLESSGDATVRVRAADPRPFLDIVRSQMAAHPALDRLVDNAAWFENADLTARIAFGESQGGGIGVRVGGTANGSRIDLNYLGEAPEDLFAAPAGQMDLTVENADASILLGQAGLQPLPLPLDQAGILTLLIAQPEGDGAAETTLTFTTDDASVTASGQVSLQAEDFLRGQMRVDIDSSDLAPYLLAGGVQVPALLDGLAVKGGADVAIGDTTVAAEKIVGEIAGTPISGTLTVDRGQSRPKVTGVLSLGTLDLAVLAESVFGPLSDPATGDRNTQPLGMASIAGLDGTVKFTTSRLSPGVGGELTDVSGSLVLNDGSLALEDISGTWLGGTVTGRLALTNANASGFAQLKLTIENGDLAAVTPRPGGVAAATGRFGLTLIGEAAGASVDEILHSFNGSGSAMLREVDISRFDLTLLPALTAMFDAEETEITEASVREAIGPLLARAPVRLGDVSVPFNITDSVVRVQNLTVPAGTAAIRADGRFDLRGAGVEISADVTLDAGDEEVTGAEPAFRVDLIGDVAGPLSEISVTDLTNYLSLRAFERERRRVETLQSNVLEKQRLRREVALYRALDLVREETRLKEEEARKLQAAEEARLRALAAERRAREIEEQRLNATPDDGSTGTVAPTGEIEAPEVPAADPAAAPGGGSGGMPVPAQERVTRGAPLPPLKFEGLPGVY
ncbi:AsmA family protein [Ciceribacter sp. L1K23]|uniref:AsmA family protein n=1 Tax=Ciceribacter sp. L1K23 TaxID=2820276 RepID=UPI001B829CDD|nr:AsmA family protein [Ciceribacter sp. L1K23]MBR0555149.1 AsmA family protein [Ciceribacter sp. L1K23]